MFFYIERETSNVFLPNAGKYWRIHPVPLLCSKTGVRKSANLVVSNSESSNTSDICEWTLARCLFRVQLNSQIMNERHDPKLARCYSCNQARTGMVQFLPSVRVQTSQTHTERERAAVCFLFFARFYMCMIHSPTEINYSIHFIYGADKIQYRSCCLLSI